MIVDRVRGKMWCRKVACHEEKLEVKLGWRLQVGERGGGLYVRVRVDQL